MTDGRMKKTQRDRAARKTTSVSMCKTMSVSLAQTQNNKKTYVPAKSHESFSSIIHVGLMWKTTKLTTGTELDKI